MKHPEIFLIPIFGLADYYLTLAGLVLREKKYGDHFQSDHYELNPVWQKTIARKEWFNPFHLFLTAGQTLMIYYVVEIMGMPEDLVAVLFGFYFVGSGMIIGSHLEHILTYWQVIRKPSHLSGQVYTSHSLSLLESMHRSLVLLVPMSLILWFAPSPFVLGGTLFAGLLIVTHGVWIFLDWRKRRI